MSVKTSKPTLDKTHPEIAGQWHPTKNGDLKPEMVTRGSNKKVWWICKKKHEWEASIVKRSGGNKCPYCSNHKVGYGNDLESQDPTLSKEWHPDKNGDLKPYMVVPGSGKKVWWLCDKEHEWETSIYNRSKGTRCPHCWAISRRSG